MTVFKNSPLLVACKNNTYLICKIIFMLKKNYLLLANNFANSSHRLLWFRGFTFQSLHYINQKGEKSSRNRSSLNFHQ